MIDPASVAEAVAAITMRMRAAAAGRDVQLIAVTKGTPAGVVDQAITAGVEDVGENRIQEAEDKHRDVRKRLADS